MNAHPNEQRILLQLIDFDTQLLQLAHQLKTLPYSAQLAEFDDADATTGRERLEAVSTLEAARAELRKIEADVELVQARIVRDTEREAGSSSAKDVSALEHELQALRERLAMLEDIELERMEQVELAERAVAEIDAHVSERATARTVIAAQLDTEVARINAAREELTADRRAIAATIDPALLAEFERLRERTGHGAGLLRQKTCGACSMVLTGTDLERIRQAASDSVVHCPECGAILIRTEESGL